MGDTVQSAVGKICPMCGYVSPSDELVCPEDGTTLTVPASQALVGTVLASKYRIDALLGSGGMGSVYKAEQLLMKRTVAVKVLHGSMSDDQELRIKRFKQEGELVAQLDHPNIIRALDFDVFNNQAFLVMDYVDGINLWDEICELGALPLARAVNIFVQVCDALAYAHSKDIIHRDIKPSNIMLTRGDDGTEIVKLLDFGVAKLIRPDQENAPHLTKTGVVFGSPPYMSPEQCMGQMPDARSDIYSLGCVMYETISGQGAIEGANSLEILHKQISDFPSHFAVLPTEVEVPSALESVIFKALEKKPANRYQTMHALKIDLLRALSDPSFDAYASAVTAEAQNDAVPAVKRNKVELMIVAAVLLVLVTTGGIYLWDQKELGTATRLPLQRAVGDRVTDLDVHQIESQLAAGKFKEALAGSQALYEDIKRRNPQDLGRFSEMLALIDASYKGLDEPAERNRWFLAQLKDARSTRAQELVTALAPFIDEVKFDDNSAPESAIPGTGRAVTAKPK